MTTTLPPMKTIYTTNRLGQTISYTLMQDEYDELVEKEVKNVLRARRVMDDQYMVRRHFPNDNQRRLEARRLRLARESTAYGEAMTNVERRLALIALDGNRRARRLALTLFDQPKAVSK